MAWLELPGDVHGEVRGHLDDIDTEMLDCAEQQREPTLLMLMRVRGERYALARRLGLVGRPHSWWIARIVETGSHKAANYYVRQRMRCVADYMFHGGRYLPQGIEIAYIVADLDALMPLLDRLEYAEYGRKRRAVYQYLARYLDETMRWIAESRFWGRGGRECVGPERLRAAIRFEWFKPEMVKRVPIWKLRRAVERVTRDVDELSPAQLEVACECARRVRCPLRIRNERVAQQLRTAGVDVDTRHGWRSRSQW